MLKSAGGGGGGGGATPGGADTDVQFNNAGAFGGMTNVTYADVGSGIKSMTFTDTGGGNHDVLRVVGVATDSPNIAVIDNNGFSLRIFAKNAGGLGVLNQNGNGIQFQNGGTELFTIKDAPFTGVNNAVFAAANAPGNADLAVRNWLHVTSQGSTYYLPLFGV